METRWVHYKYILEKLAGILDKMYKNIIDINGRFNMNRRFLPEHGKSKERKKVKRFHLPLIYNANKSLYFSFTFQELLFDHLSFSLIIIMIAMVIIYSLN